MPVKTESETSKYDYANRQNRRRARRIAHELKSRAKLQRVRGTSDSRAPAPQGTDFFLNFRTANVLGVHIHRDGSGGHTDFELCRSSFGGILLAGSSMRLPLPSRQAAESYALDVLSIMLARDESLARVPEPDGADGTFRIDDVLFDVPGHLLQHMHQFGPLTEATAIEHIADCRRSMGGRVTATSIAALSGRQLIILQVAMASLLIARITQYPICASALH